MNRITSSVMPSCRSISWTSVRLGREGVDAVDALLLAVDLVGELLLAPIVEPDDGAAGLFDRGADAPVDLGTALVVRLRMEHHHEFVLVDDDHLLWSVAAPARVPEQG